MGLFFFGCLVFPKAFRQLTKPSRKPHILKTTKQNQTNLRENTKTLSGKQEHQRTPKTQSGKPKKQTNKQPFPRVGLKPLTTLFFFCFCFPKVVLVVFGIVGFPGSLFGFLKTFGKTNKTTTRKNTYPRVGLKPLNTLFVLVVPKVVWVFFGVLWYFWFSRICVWFSKNLMEHQQNKQDQTHIQGWV